MVSNLTKVRQALVFPQCQSESGSFSFTLKCLRNTKYCLPSNPRLLMLRLQLGVSAHKEGTQERLRSRLAVGVGVTDGRRQRQGVLGSFAESLNF